MRRAVIVGVVFVIAALVGCAAETPGAATAGTVGTRTVSVAPATSETSGPPIHTVGADEQQAAKRYLAIVRPYNKAMERFRATTFGADAAKTIRGRLNLAQYGEGVY